MTDWAADRAGERAAGGADREGAAGREGSEPALVELLRDEIRRSGPITFARFMEIALYHPLLGYYATTSAHATRSGDFLTAPELHPVFGRCLARQLAECWERLGRPDDFTLREYGAGSGILAASLIRGLEADRSPLATRLRYEPVEVNERRRDAVLARLRAEGLGDRQADSTDAPTTPGQDGPAGLGDQGGPAAEDGDRPPGPASRIVGVILANEFLDALPVHRVEGSADGLREVYVDRDGEAFVDRPGPPSDPALESRLEAEGVRLAPGQRAEVRPAADAWVREVSETLARGWVLVIDYGRPAAELYSRTRWAGTVLGYLGHRVVDDPYANVGRQDLTAHVDLTAVEAAAIAAGLTVEGTTTQAEFLTSLGLGDLLAEEAGRTTDAMLEYLALRGAALRLLDPRHLGGFAVVILGRAVPGGPPLRGLGLRIRGGAAG